MTPQDHAKTLGLIYLAVGGLLSLLPLGFFVWLALVSDAEFKHSLNFTKWSVGGLLMSVGVLLLLLVALSLALVGIGFLRHRRWVRLPALILCAPAVLSFPFGTGLAVYTWWFLHSKGGRRIFGKEQAQMWRTSQHLAALALLAATLACGGAPPENDGRRAISLAETEGRTHQAMTAEMRAEGITPLMYVAGYGDADNVSDFLARGEDVKARDKDGWTALHHATLGGVHDDVMRLLIRAGADVNARTPGGETPLMFSARKGKVEEVRTLVEAGADVNAANGLGETALIMVADLGHSEEEAEAVTELLLRAGADANAKDSSGQTAMRLAKESKRARIVKLLKDAGADR